MDVNKKIFELFKAHEITYDLFVHESASTCESASAKRGLDLSVGAKSILFKGKSGFCVFTIRADRGVSSLKVRKILGSNKLRFASHEELMKLCHVVKGALPPLAGPLYGLAHYADKSLMSGEKVVFNAGILTESVVISTSDFLRLADPIICEFSDDSYSISNKYLP